MHDFRHAVCGKEKFLANHDVNLQHGVLLGFVKLVEKLLDLLIALLAID